MPAKLALAALIAFTGSALAAEPYPDRPSTSSFHRRLVAARMYSAAFSASDCRNRSASRSLSTTVPAPVADSASRSLPNLRRTAIPSCSPTCRMRSGRRSRAVGLHHARDSGFGFRLGSRARDRKRDAVGDAPEHPDLQGRRHRSCRRALVGRARAGRPAPEIAARLTRELKAILDSPEFATRLATSRASPAQFRALIEGWADIVMSVGISTP
jgi:hypothetical protein